LLLDDDLERYGLEVFVRELIYEGKDYRRVRRQMLIDAREKAIPLYNM
jgi:hypothetical protein